MLQKMLLWKFLWTLAPRCHGSASEGPEWAFISKYRFPLVSSQPHLELPRWNLKLVPVFKEWKKTEERKPFQIGRWQTYYSRKLTCETFLGWWIDSYTHPPNLKLIKEPYLGSVHIPCRYSQHHITSPSQDRILGAASGSGEGTWNLHSKDRGGSEEPLSAQVQLIGQLAVMSSQWGLLTPLLWWSKGGVLRLTNI